MVGVNLTEEDLKAIKNYMRLDGQQILEIGMNEM